MKKKSFAKSFLLGMLGGLKLNEMIVNKVNGDKHEKVLKISCDLWEWEVNMRSFYSGWFSRTDMF